MSLSEVQEVYTTLQEIDTLISNLITKTETLRTTGESTTVTLREVEYVFFRITSLLGRMGLPPEIDAAIMKVQQLILVIRVLHSAAKILWTDPSGIGLIIGLAAMFGGLLSTATMMDMEKPTY